MDRFARTVLLGILLGTTACGSGNAIFGKIPETACRTTRNLAEASQLTGSAEADRIYRKLIPLFGELRNREVPFTVETTEYTVTDVRITALRRSCDIAATVCASPAGAVQGETFRLYYLALNSKGSVFARGIVIASPVENDGQWQGEATFHLFPDAAQYGDFKRIAFVSRERFNAAAQEIRTN